MKIKQRVFQKDPETLTPFDEDYCHRCGHWIDFRILTRLEFHRAIFEQLCPICQKEVEDPCPELTESVVKI